MPFIRRADLFASKFKGKKVFIVTISLKTDLIPKERTEELFAEHRGWFIKYAEYVVREFKAIMGKIS